MDLILSARVQWLSATGSRWIGEEVKPNSVKELGIRWLCGLSV